MHWKISQIEEKQQALFAGFFGPIGVSAVFYLYVTLEFLRGITVDGVVREDAAQLGEVMTVVIWFLAICSIVSYFCQTLIKGRALTIQVVHGLSVPLGKLGYHLPRTISSAIESREIDEPELFRFRRANNEEQTLRNRHRRRLGRRSQDEPARPVFRAGGSIIQPGITGLTELPMQDEPARPVFRAGGSIIKPGITGSTTPRDRTTHGVKLEGISRSNSMSGKIGEMPAGGIEGGAGVGFMENVSTPVNGNGAPEQKVDEQGKMTSVV